MCAFDLAWSKVGRLGDERDGDLIPVTAFTFEAPRVGKQCSVLYLSRMHLKSEKGIPVMNTASQGYGPC